VIPQAELHVHLEGTAPPSLIHHIAARNDLPVPSAMLDSEGHFRFTDFLDFLRTYDLAASVIRTGEDYRDITYEYLRGLAKQGAIYAELTASPDHAALVGLTDEEHLRGIAAGIDDARIATGIEGRILISAVKNFGLRQALRVARHAAERPHPYVVGFSMAGDEQFPPTDFAEPYRIASEAGLGCVIHAGEWGGPASVRGALELPVTRIDHGVRAIEDPELVSELANRGMVLNVCPTSNVVLGVYPSYEEHPLPKLRAAGVKFTLNSDDPPYFGATLAGEYEIAASHYGFSEADLTEVTATAIDAAFCDDALKATLRAQL
jgi:adenosine deaminase